MIRVFPESGFLLLHWLAGRLQQTWNVQLLPL